LEFDLINRPNYDGLDVEKSDTYIVYNNNTTSIFPDDVAENCFKERMKIRLKVHIDQNIKKYEGKPYFFVDSPGSETSNAETPNILADVVPSALSTVISANVSAFSGFSSPSATLLSLINVDSVAAVGIPSSSASVSSNIPATARLEELFLELFKKSSENILVLQFEWFSRALLWSILGVSNAHQDLLFAILGDIWQRIVEYGKLFFRSIDILTEQNEYNVMEGKGVATTDLLKQLMSSKAHEMVRDIVVFFLRCFSLRHHHRTSWKYQPDNKKPKVLVDVKLIQVGEDWDLCCPVPINFFLFSECENVIASGGLREVFEVNKVSSRKTSSVPIDMTLSPTEIIEDRQSKRRRVSNTELVDLVHSPAVLVELASSPASAVFDIMSEAFSDGKRQCDSSDMEQLDTSRSKRAKVDTGEDLLNTSSSLNEEVDTGEDLLNTSSSLNEDVDALRKQFRSSSLKELRCRLLESELGLSGNDNLQALLEDKKQLLPSNVFYRDAVIQNMTDFIIRPGQEYFFKNVYCVSGSISQLVSWQFGDALQQSVESFISQPLEEDVVLPTAVQSLISNGQVSLMVSICTYLYNINFYFVFSMINLVVSSGFCRHFCHRCKIVFEKFVQKMPSDAR
jgi:hypothetical protein